MRGFIFKRLAFVALASAFAISCQSSAVIDANADVSGSMAMKLQRSSDPSSRLGVIARKQNGQLCFETSDRDLGPSDSLTIVNGGFLVPVGFVDAEIVAKDPSCRSEFVNTDSDSFEYYSIKTDRDSDELHAHVAIAKYSGTKQINDGSPQIDLDRDGQLESFRHCASYEGVHFTLWKGEPLKSERIWHRYFYLGYDTEFDCEPKDYEIN